MYPDLILTNGRFHTIDPINPTATAVAISQGRILAVGNDDNIKSLKGNDTEMVDLNGRTVTPGLVDAHVHFQGFATSLQRVNLIGTTSLDEALDRIRGKQSTVNNQQSTDNWIQGRGWAQDDWQDRQFPTATALDTITGNHPALLRDKSGHAGWVNSRALRIAGITANTPDPAGGTIQRDSDGNPTGILFEDAIKLVQQHIPRPTVAEIADAMRHAQAYCWRVGLTGIHDFDGRSCFQALQQLHQNNELGLRFVKNIPVYRLEHAIGVGLQSGFGDEWIRIGGIKIFADGALGPRTAAMLAPYENEPTNLGIVVTDKEEMMEKAAQAATNGLSVTVHAIGDRANHDILDVYESLNTHPSSLIPHPSLRHRIEHVQLLHPTDLNRLAKLNVIASMQPIHATSDIDMASRYWGDRTQYSYAWRTMLNSGATLVFGSDAPVEKIDPILGIHAAVSRRRPNGHPHANGWHPEQRLTMPETIHAFTMAAAITAGTDSQSGSITLGKHADLTIFDRDIFQIPHDELLDTPIAATLVNGTFKHRTF
ncbi:MAG: amidohydrolase [Chloroflexi bacterium]|nr:amidohydrolase [Chloroflexota bacterium]